MEIVGMQILKRPKLKDRFLTGVPQHTKLKPVVTVVCYFGTQPWDRPRCLHELFEIKNPKLKAFVPDYPIVILDPHTLSNAQLELLDTSLREVFTCIKASRDRKTLKEIVNSSPRFQHMDPDAVNLSCFKYRYSNKFKPRGNQYVPSRFGINTQGKALHVK